MSDTGARPVGEQWALRTCAEKHLFDLPADALQTEAVHCRFPALASHGSVVGIPIPARHYCPMLRNSLSAGLGLSARQVEGAFAKAGVSARQRAESLSLDEWASVAAELAPLLRPVR